MRKNLYFLLLSMILCTNLSAFANFGFGNHTLTFNSFVVGTFEDLVESEFSIIFNDPNVSITFEGKTYNYNIEQLGHLKSGGYGFVLSEDKKSVIYLWPNDSPGSFKELISIKVPGLEVMLFRNDIESISSFNSLVKALQTVLGK